MSTKNILAALSEASSYVTLATNVGGVLIPIAVGLVKEIKQIAAGQETVTYQVLIQTDAAELEAVDKLSKDDLAAINAELAKLGKPPVPPIETVQPQSGSSSSAASPSAGPAPGTGSST